MANDDTTERQDDGSAKVDPVVLWEMLNTKAYHSRPGSPMSVKSLVAEGWGLLKAKMRADGKYVATYLKTKGGKP